MDELAKERIAYHVTHKGHGIPNRDVDRMFVESRTQLEKILPLCGVAVLYDNTESFYRIAIYKSGRIKNLFKKQPRWYTEMDFFYALRGYFSILFFHAYAQCLVRHDKDLTKQWPVSLI